MSLLPINIQDHIERIATIFEKDTTLFPAPTDGKPLVTKIIRNKPAIEQSANSGIVPYILVFESDQPIRFLEKAGRDGRDVAGGDVYESEIYCVAITKDEINTERAQKAIHNITQAMRTALDNNKRLAKPGTLTDPICRTHTRFEIRYLLKGTISPGMVARNIIVRPQTYVSPRDIT